ncbi:MAG: GNAT family N-acetyltransferase [Bacteroidales bacterium]|nr:GNAT family N-acetyltransferase [Bacteroidales bacterium]
MIGSEERNLDNYYIRRLQENETIKSFDCGDDDLNDFIMNRADDYHKAMLSVTYVFEHKASGKIIGYFSLANDKISIDDFGNNTEFNRFRRKRFTNEKRIRSYPSVKICRLGIDNDFRGFGVGTKLINFIKLFYSKDNKAGCRFLTVDAYHNAVAFYERNMFQILRDDDRKTHLLYYDLNEMRNVI